uniref:Uncharacterized protein n=1 Tax=Anas platyrhynchos TaxID=8839 RepID=A0A8B9ZEX5_ANAPL
QQKVFFRRVLGRRIGSHSDSGTENVSVQRNAQTRGEVLDVVVEGGKGKVRCLSYCKRANLWCLPSPDLCPLPLNSQMCFTNPPVLEIQAAGGMGW